MRAQFSRCYSTFHVSTVLAILTALILAGCGKEPTAEGDSSQDTTQNDSSHSTQKDGLVYFADDVVQAWEQAAPRPYGSSIMTMARSRIVRIRPVRCLRI